MAFAVFHSATFDKGLNKLSKDFRNWVDKIESQLIENPYVGDPISVTWFREKKKDNYRIYYLIYNELNAVYLVGISDKKDQQKIINSIWLLLSIFRQEITKLLDKKQ